MPSVSLGDASKSWLMVSVVLLFRGENAQTERNGRSWIDFPSNVTAAIRMVVQK
jgi:hypothetical protein